MAGFVLTFGPKSALCCLKRPRSATRQPPAPFLRRCNAWMDLPASDERQMCAGHSGCSSQFFAPGPFCSPHALETPPQSHIRRYPSRECFSPAQRALSRAFDRCMAARASHCAPPPKSMNECCGLRTFTVARVMNIPRSSRGGGPPPRAEAGRDSRESSRGRALRAAGSR